jgi:hypothetical protein
LSLFIFSLSFSQLTVDLPLDDVARVEHVARLVRGGRARHPVSAAAAREATRVSEKRRAVDDEVLRGGRASLSLSLSLSLLLL